MRYKFIILFLFISFVSKAQVYQLMPQYGYSTYRMNFDSTIQIPTFCGVPKLGSNKINKGALAFDSCNNRFYFFNPKSQAWDTIKSGSTVDTTKFVRYTDTSAMLLPYLRKVDTTNRFVSSVTKLNDSTIQVIKGTTTSNITISSVTSATRLITQVWNNTGATILRGSVVYISGRHSSNLPTIALAQGNNEANSYKTFALVDGDIPDNSAGFVIQAGKITGLNLPTSSYTDGDILYLSPTVAGGYTITKPLAPNHICKLGSVTRAHPTQGSIEIKIENGWQLDELSDVQIAAVPADSTLLQFSRVDSLWHDVSPLTAIGNRYLKPTDSVSLSNRINLKLNISDTSAMLSPYARTNVTNAALALKLNISDTASMLSPYARTNSVNASLATKLNISDTSTMLSPYLRSNTANASYVTSVFRKTASDSVFFVRGGTNNFAFRDSAGGANIYNTDGSLTGARTLTLNNFPLSIAGNSAANTSRFHANGNVTIGTAAVGTNDSTYKLNVVSSGGNAVSFVMRSGVGGGQRITFTQNDVTNTINSNTHTVISCLNTMSVLSTNSVATIGSAANNTTFVGYNGSSGAITPVLMGTDFNTSANASSLLELRSTTRGFLQPRLTTTQMNAISTPATGLSVFNTTDSVEYTYRGTRFGWQKNVIYNRNNDVALFNGANQRIMIDTVASTISGRNLTIEAGNSTTNVTENFVGLGQTSRTWHGIVTAPNGDIYATVVNGDIWKSTNNGVTFTALNATGTNRAWIGITIAPNGDIYAVVKNGDIYKSTNNGTSWTALGQTSRSWFGIAAASNGDIFATVDGGDIYKQTGGTGNFVGLGQTNRRWFGIAIANNGDIYVAEITGDIWRSINGGTTFTALGQTSRNWVGIAISSNNIYASTYGGDIYKQTNATGNFVALNQTNRNWTLMTYNNVNGNIYACVENGDIFTSGGNTANLNGGTLVLQSGVGKGTGTSTINFNTGTTLTSGATLQTASTKMTILGNGNVGIGTTSPSSILDVSSTTSAFLPPRMTTAQRDLITPVAGMVIYNSTTNKHQGYNGTTWNDFY